jgi:anti-sigma regulatory factor (Ser/Thr protein kinase)
MTLNAAHAAHDLLLIQDSSEVGQARRAIDALARKIGLPTRASESAQNAATELATNVLLHGKGGYLLLRPLDNPRGLELIAVDRGNGMADPTAVRAARTGSAGGLGIGLASVRSHATTFELWSRPMNGTAVVTRFVAEQPAADVARAGFRSGGVSVAVVPGDANGDGWAVTHHDLTCSVMVVDGLGHGPAAHEAALAALGTFESDSGGDLQRWLRIANAAMRPTRGGVAAVVQIDAAQERLRFAGVGNINGSVVTGDGVKRLASAPGMLGTEIPLPRLRTVELGWPPGSRLVLWSDGIGSGVAAEVRAAPRADPTAVAAMLHRDFSRETDDATVVVIQDCREDLG